MGLAGIQLNMAVLGAFPVMIGLGIDYAIQFHARLDEESRKGSLDDAVFMTVTRTGPAVMYAMLATSLGFFAMFLHRAHDPVVRAGGHHRDHDRYCISLVGIPAVAQVIHYKPKQQTPTSAMRSVRRPAIPSRYQRKVHGPTASFSPPHRSRSRKTRSRFSLL